MKKTDFRSRVSEVEAQALERRKSLAIERGWKGVVILFSASIVFGHPPGMPLGSTMEEVPHFEPARERGRGGRVRGDEGIPQA